MSKRKDLNSISDPQTTMNPYWVVERAWELGRIEGIRKSAAFISCGNNWSAKETIADNRRDLRAHARELKRRLK